MYATSPIFLKNRRTWKATFMERLIFSAYNLISVKFFILFNARTQNMGESQQLFNENCFAK